MVWIRAHFSGWGTSGSKFTRSFFQWIHLANQAIDTGSLPPLLPPLYVVVSGSLALNVSIGTKSRANILPLLSLLPHIQFNPLYHIQSTRSRRTSGLLQTFTTRNSTWFIATAFDQDNLLKRTLFSFFEAQPFCCFLTAALVLWRDPRSKSDAGLGLFSLPHNLSPYDNNHEHAPVFYILSRPSSIL